MKRKTLIVLTLVLFCHSVHAVETNNNMVNGAATIPKDKRAFSFDLGADLPEPILYGARLDWGLSERYQLGVAGNFLGVMGTFGLNNTLNFFRDQHKTHYLSFQFSPAVLLSKTSSSVSLNPALAYEWRYGKRKPTGLFVKLGMLSYVDTKTGDFLIDDEGRIFHWRWLTGLQFQTGKRFAFTVEAGVFANLDFQNPFPIGKLGFTWGF